MEATIIILVVINIFAVAFSYGKLHQKVTDLNHRLTRIEGLLNRRRL